VVLERSGYTVLEADSSDAALHFCQHYPEIIHVMVVDMVIPNMSGWQLAERVISLRPGIKVLYLSGYNQDALHDQGILGLETPYLQKPFTPNALATKVQEILQTS
jgi:two-component system, cell cycle sensor histidine kinase and response regulator CckA